MTGKTGREKDGKSAAKSRSLNSYVSVLLWHIYSAVLRMLKLTLSSTKVMKIDISPGLTITFLELELEYVIFKMAAQ